MKLGNIGGMFLWYNIYDVFFVTDPFQNDFPEIVEECLQQRAARCVGFNRRGTLLAGKASGDALQCIVPHTRMTMWSSEAEISMLEK